MDRLARLAVHLPFPPVALVLSLCLLACAGTPITPDRITSPGEALFNGRVKPDVNCYKCHNGDGTGTMRGPNLAKRVPGLTDQQIAQAILEGPGFMPSFKDKVDANDIAQITAWLRQRFPKAP
jgi:mono/diheme cytochrome c family protein